jgi:membrane-associated phospholipid phosphatase
VTVLDLIVNFSLAVVLIVGAYQFYFWCQRRTQKRARRFSFKLDNAIRLRPWWVWIYSGAYYPAFGVVVLSTKDLRSFNYMAFSYLLLLGLQMLIFLLFPVEVPPGWRQSRPNAPSRSQNLLSFVQRFDARGTCFPSMHISVATLTALHTVRNTNCGWALPASFVMLIAVSCVLTKQHYIMDVPGGVILGWLSFNVFRHLL